MASNKISASAVQRVFGIVELAEAILLHLPPESILRCEQVSHVLHDTLRGSNKLQTKTFRSSTPDMTVFGLPEPPASHAMVNPMVMECQGWYWHGRPAVFGNIKLQYSPQQHFEKGVQISFDFREKRMAKVVRGVMGLFKSVSGKKNLAAEPSWHKQYLQYPLRGYEIKVQRNNIIAQAQVACCRVGDLFKIAQEMKVTGRPRTAGVLQWREKSKGGLDDRQRSYIIKEPVYIPRKWVE